MGCGDLGRGLAEGLYGCYGPMSGISFLFYFISIYVWDRKTLSVSFMNIYEKSHLTFRLSLSPFSDENDRWVKIHIGGLHFGLVVSSLLQSYTLRSIGFGNFQYLFGHACLLVDNFRMDDKLFRISQRATEVLQLQSTPGIGYNLKPNIIAASVTTWVLAAVSVGLRLYTRSRIIKVIGPSDWVLVVSLVSLPLVSCSYDSS